MSSEYQIGKYTLYQSPRYALLFESDWRHAWIHPTSTAALGLPPAQDLRAHVRSSCWLLIQLPFYDLILVRYSPDLEIDILRLIGPAKA